MQSVASSTSCSSSLTVISCRGTCTLSLTAIPCCLMCPGATSHWVGGVSFLLKSCIFTCKAGLKSTASYCRSQCHTSRVTCAIPRPECTANRLEGQAYSLGKLQLV